MEKSYWIFVEGSRVMLNSGLAYKNTLSMMHSIDKFCKKLDKIRQIVKSCHVAFASDCMIFK